jgi:hypothetical protein
MGKPHLQHSYRAKIAPVPGGVARPLWSVMIPTFHCASFLGETLESVLAQDPGPEVMQIEVVDDHSTNDDPEAVVHKVGKGRITFFRQPKNVGHTRNFEACLQRSRGKLVHLLHGDDCVRPGFYAAMERAFERQPRIGAAFCRQVFIDEFGQQQSVSALEQPQSGILENWLERLAEEQRIMTPSIVVRRDVYEFVGAFDARLVCSEDWEMWVRIAARYPIWYEVEPLALYRMHLHSNTGRHIRSGEDISFTCMAIDLFREYLPKEIADRVARRAKQTYAFSALEMARAMVAKRDWAAMRSQIRAALGCSRSMRVWLRLMQFGVWSAAFSLKRMVVPR